MNWLLIVHIGTAKTGSTSTQRSLLALLKFLRINEIFCWGLNFKRCNPGFLLYDRRSDSRTCILQRFGDVETSKQVIKVLDSDLPLLGGTAEKLDGFGRLSSSARSESSLAFVLLKAMRSLQLCNDLNLKLLALPTAYISANKHIGIVQAFSKSNIILNP